MQITVEQYEILVEKLRALKWEASDNPNVMVKVRGRSAVWVYRIVKGGVVIGWGGDLRHLKQQWQYGQATISLGEDRGGRWRYYIARNHTLSKPDFSILQQFVEVCQAVGLPPAECYPFTLKEKKG